MVGCSYVMQSLTQTPAEENERDWDKNFKRGTWISAKPTRNKVKCIVWLVAGALLLCCF